MPKIGIPTLIALLNEPFHMIISMASDILGYKDDS